MQIDPEAAAVVQRIFAMTLGGIGARRIARILNSEGIPSPTAYKQMNGMHYKIAAKNPNASLWSCPTIYQMLHNQTYTGDLVQGRHKKVSYKSPKTVWLPESEWIVAPDTHEAIIGRETFERVQEMLKDRARSGSGGMVHPLARKVVCGCCGSIMEQCGSGAVRADGTKRKYLRCRMHQRAPDRCPNKTCTDLNALKETVLQRIRAYAEHYFDPQKVDLPRREAPDHKRDQARREELRRLKSEVERRRKAMEELYLDKASGLIDAGMFSRMNQSFLQEVKQAEARMEVLETELGQQKAEKEEIEAQMRRVRQLAEAPALTRELVVLLVHRVVVSPKDPETGKQAVTIEWNF